MKKHWYYYNTQVVKDGFTRAACGKLVDAKYEVSSDPDCAVCKKAMDEFEAAKK